MVLPSPYLKPKAFGAGVVRHNSKPPSRRPKEENLRCTEPPTKRTTSTKTPSKKTITDKNKQPLKVTPHIQTNQHQKTNNNENHPQENLAHQKDQPNKQNKHKEPNNLRKPKKTPQTEQNIDPKNHPTQQNWTTQQQQLHPKLPLTNQPTNQPNKPTKQKPTQMTGSPVSRPALSRSSVLASFRAWIEIWRGVCLVGKNRPKEFSSSVGFAFFFFLVCLEKERGCYCRFCHFFGFKPNRAKR